MKKPVTARRRQGKKGQLKKASGPASPPPAKGKIARRKKAPSRAKALPLGKKIWAQKILRGLKKHYPAADCELTYKDPFQLLVATILSAQCTDQRVNLVTPPLFKRFPDARAMARARPQELEKLIHSTGLYRNKAKSILNSSRQLVQDFSGKVPNTMEELTRLPGIGRKTANVILGNAFKIPSGIAVDTHVARLAKRMGLSQHKDPLKIEPDLLALIPQKDWVYCNHALIAHGRAICKAPNPRCGDCFLRKDCPTGRMQLKPAQRSPFIPSTAAK